MRPYVLHNERHPTIFLMSIYGNDKSMKNILYFKEMTFFSRVTMDTHEDHTMLVHFNKDKLYQFKECGNGLYQLDISDLELVSPTTKDTVK